MLALLMVSTAFEGGIIDISSQKRKLRLKNSLAQSVAGQAPNDLLLGWVARVPALWCCKGLIREMTENSKGSASDTFYLRPVGLPL